MNGGGAGDRAGQLLALRAGDDRPVPSSQYEAPSTALAAEIPIGTELVALLTSELAISVDPDLGVRVRIYDSSRRTLRADIATTAVRALALARLFRLAAERADPSLIALRPPAAPGGAA